MVLNVLDTDFLLSFWDPPEFVNSSMESLKLPLTPNTLSTKYLAL